MGAHSVNYVRYICVLTPPDHNGIDQPADVWLTDSAEQAVKICERHVKAHYQSAGYSRVQNVWIKRDGQIIAHFGAGYVFVEMEA